VDADEFEAWYRDEYGRVFASVLVVCGDRSLAADVTDEAFVRAFERWPRVRAMRSPTGWTFAVARNLVRRSRRRAARERLAAPAPELVAPEIDFAIWDAVRSLPKRERELVALRYVAGLTEPEIGSALGLAVGTVSRGLHDARTRLERLLTPEKDAS
jgi:RNA polymerase sigma-70 factor (ECF subfamily)